MEKIQPKKAYCTRKINYKWWAIRLPFFILAAVVGILLYVYRVEV